LNEGTISLFGPLMVNISYFHLQEADIQTYSEKKLMEALKLKNFLVAGNIKIPLHLQQMGKY